MDRKVTEGDYVKCSYEGMLDGSPKQIFTRQTDVRQTKQHLGREGQVKGMGIEAIANAVVGMKKNDKKEIEADFPDGFEVAPNAGKKVAYSLEIHEGAKKGSGCGQ